MLEGNIAVGINVSVDFVKLGHFDNDDFSMSLESKGVAPSHFNS